MKNFYLTKRAFKDIKEIYEYSIENWGETRADEYVNSLYKAFHELTNNTTLGESRKYRSTPFLMYPSGKHYIVYEPYKDSILIITVLHQVRNIENIIQEFGSPFYDEIKLLKSKID